MDGRQMSLQEIIDTVGEWHDLEGISEEQNTLLAVFCAFADIHYQYAESSESSNQLNALRVALEAAYQLGRANCRQHDGFFGV